MSKGKHGVKWFIETTEASESTIAERLGTKTTPHFCRDSLTRELRECDRAFIDRVVRDEFLVGEEMVTIFVNEGNGVRKYLGQLRTPDPVRSLLHA